MGYAENREGYWRGRYKIATGKYGTVTDATGATIRFRTKREAKRAADAEEAKVRARSLRTVTTTWSCIERSSIRDARSVVANGDHPVGRHYSAEPVTRGLISGLDQPTRST